MLWLLPSIFSVAVSIFVLAFSLCIYIFLVVVNIVAVAIFVLVTSFFNAIGSWKRHKLLEVLIAPPPPVLMKILGKLIIVPECHVVCQLALLDEVSVRLIASPSKRVFFLLLWS